MTPTLRLAAMRAVFVVFMNREGEVTNNVHKSQAGFDEKGELKRNRTEVLLLTT